MNTQTNRSTEQILPSLEEFQLIVDEQKQELEQLAQEQDEKMRLLNNIDAIYEHIKIDLKAIATPEPMQEQIPDVDKNKQTSHTQQNVSGIGAALSNFLTSKKKDTTPNGSLASPLENLQDVLKRQEIITGRNKVKLLVKDTNSQLDSLLNDSLSSKDAESLVKQIKNNITEINQDIHLTLKATHHKNGTELEKALNKMKTDVNHLSKLSERIQKDSSALDIRNNILPDASKLDFAALSGSIRDSANKMTTLLKVFTKKLDPSSLQVG
ncbi:hypothetical protein [Vibrio harveyi]|uniref:hypothetical protein n=1 Tax=Vibrio harveyi TaxID=669 RepID=UPI0024800494|nr:hypothetical protein [Vibrio harveyi]